MLRFVRRMSTQRSYKDAVEALNSLQTNFATIEAIRQRGGNSNEQAIPQMVEWARRAGYSDINKLNDLNAIHVTGTKGKGSTCAFVQSILNQYQGESKLSKVGLYTSPHLKSVRERIRLNGEPISEELFAKYFFEVWDNIESCESDLTKFPDAGPGSKPGYFRYMTLLSFHVFLREKVDTAIYEVGIGGEYDSTNIIPKPAVTGVSSLGIDHVNILGDTIESIAWHKAGIFKPGAPALTVQQPETALKVLKDRAAERRTELTVVDVFSEIPEISLGLKGKFQELNASLAIKLCELFLKKGGFNVDTGDALPDKFVKGVEDASWPGRCQTIEDGDVEWLLDGAHTQESITEAAKWYGSKASKDTTKVLLFNQQTRDANALVGTLHKVLESYNVQFDHVVFTTNVTFAEGYSADLISHNTSKADVDALVVQNALAEAWSKLDDAERHVFGNIQHARDYIKTLSPAQVFVTGSLHLVGGFLAVHEA